MEINELVNQFEEERLPQSEWTHHGHLAVCVWYVWHYPLASLPDKLRTNIKKYNISVGGKNTESAGYHESITLFWLCITKAFIDDNGFKSPEEAYEAMIAGPHGKSDFLFTYYSKDNIKRVKARMEWVEPDLKGVDTYGSFAGSIN